MSKGIIVQGANIGKTMSHALSKLAKYVVYSDVSDEESRKESKGILEYVVSSIRGIDIPKCSKEDLNALGFYQCTTNMNLYLMPLWIFGAIKEGTELVDVDGNHVIVGKDEIDLTTRYGCIKYGFTR